ncbi:putative transcription factor C2H2 family [Helianthus annuus]|nr:putative transcription factor C2H2 family [Helianthus annuus]
MGIDKTQELTYEQNLEIRRNLFREFTYLKKRVRDDDDSYTPELEREGPNKKRNKYECLNCNKLFTSFQGLGGHRPCHKKNNTVGSKHDSGENSLEGDFAHTRKAKYDKKTKVKKIKGHECLICFRMFKSGQALGGHKRCHWQILNLLMKILKLKLLSNRCSQTKQVKIRWIYLNLYLTPVNKLTGSHSKSRRTTIRGLNNVSFTFIYDFFK